MIVKTTTTSLISVNAFSESNRQSHSFAEQSTEIPKNQTFLSRDGHISPRPTQSQKHQITQVVAETSLSKEEPKTEIQPDYHVAGDVQVRYCYILFA